VPISVIIDSILKQHFTYEPKIMTDITTDTTPQWHDVAALDSLDPDFPTSVEVNKQAIGLFLSGDEVHALEDVCPHAFALLSQGFQEDGFIECPLHAAKFEIATGKCMNEIGQRDLKVFPIKVENGRVCIQA
jgi:nitrite reductase/ring-hydroxylating ferredoxin subunit